MAAAATRFNMAAMGLLTDGALAWCILKTRSTTPIQHRQALREGSVLDKSDKNYRHGDYLILASQRQVLHRGHRIELEAKVFELIELLLDHRDVTLDKQDIVTALWGHRPVTDAALSQLVYKARRVFHDDGEHQAVIRTVYGRGLQWVAPVEVVQADKQESIVAAPVEAGTVPAQRRSRKGIALTGVLVLALATLLSLVLVVKHDNASPAPPLPRIALLPIDNATGDHSEDWTTHGLPGLISSLLGSARGIDVIDPIQVANVWTFTLPAGGNRIEHTRKITGAVILVTGHLRKLGDMYELALHVDRGAGHQDQNITLTGAEPGKLAVAAVPRIRQILHLKTQDEQKLVAAPGDPYLAQTFARGMDAGARGRWSDARPYFALCAKEIPDFLPCRLRLGEAQDYTNQLAAGQRTLQDVLEAARKRSKLKIQAEALTLLAGIAKNQTAYLSALRQFKTAARLAKQVGDLGLQVSIAEGIADVAASMKRFGLAKRQLEHANDLVSRNGLQFMQPRLEMGKMALYDDQGDYVMAEKAARKALALDTALGNQGAAVNDALALAYELRNNGRSAEALPLFAYVHRQARMLQDAYTEFGADDNLAIALVNAGVTKPVPAIVEHLFEIAKRRNNTAEQAYAWILRSARQWNDGDRVASLASARKSVALIDSEQNPEAWVMLQYNVATAALLEDRASLPELSRQVDAVITKQAKPSNYAYRQQLIRAMAATAVGYQATAHTLLSKAAANTHRRDVEGNGFHRAGLIMALAGHDPDAARIALKDFDPATCDMADVLQLAAQWARQQGDTQAAQAAEKRLAFLRKSALKALRQTDMAALTAS